MSAVGKSGSAAPPAEPEVTPRLAAAHGLTEAEFAHACRVLGRPPTFTELGILSALWSEHCSYKSSRPYLKKFPTQGPRVLQGPGENAGIVDIGGGLAAVFKMESHNHPSFIEPYQGAATGVGGILRDVFTMGARPVALLNSLRFGDLSDPRSRYLLKEVVAGIAGYGNCMGVPTVGGEVAVDPCYAGNCLVNAFCLGVVRTDRIFRGRAAGVGNAVVYVGARTGRDGIHGASMASESFGEEAGEKRPAVQVGDPFLEKLLLEACLELMATEAIVAIQDMGAAGLSSASAEMAARGGVGVRIDVARVPRREAGMTPYEVMLSESQERMLMVVKPESLDAASAVFAKWDLEFAVVGEVTADGRLRVVDKERCAADLPVRLLVDEVPPPARPASAPKEPRYPPVRAAELRAASARLDPAQALRRLLSHPDLASKRYVYSQYDHMVRTDTLLRPGGDAAVLRVKGSARGLALTVDGNGRYCALDPRMGGRIAVAEAARNLSCVGAAPIGLTDCLNFGNPELPEVMWQFAEAVEGMAEACRRLGVPVVSGNVSFYNETRGENIHPTPTVAMVGLLEEAERHCPTAFQRAGDSVVLLGPPEGSSPGSGGSALGGSAYLWHVLGLRRGPCPGLDLEGEAALQALCRRAVAEGLLSSCHDVSDGGLAVALAECGLLADPPLGVSAAVPWEGEPEALLFGEEQGRVVASLPADRLPRLESLGREAGVPLQALGTVGGDRFVIRVSAGSSLPVIDAAMGDLGEEWRWGLERALGMA
ncbi:MAG: phosphoribosylformylglycinamidine synthase subunit PurL [Candidatus Tectomicrobia bacterium]|nr:phosphoribosylformylglycinamidine synthase subunit PurL [Candidatus Tectomicrobia bacterium]